MHWRNTSGINVLRIAARNGHIGIADMIVEGIEDPEELRKYVNKTNQDGWGCLHSAAENGRVDMVKWLIDRYDGILIESVFMVSLYFVRYAEEIYCQMKL